MEKKTGGRWISWTKKKQRTVRRKQAEGETNDVKDDASYDVEGEGAQDIGYTQILSLVSCRNYHYR